MRTPQPNRIALFLSLAVTAALVAGCDEEEEISQEEAGPTIGVMELPVSLRTDDRAPNNPLRIEVSPTGLGLDGSAVVSLDGGVLPEAEKSEGAIPKLRDAIAAGAARRGATLRLHVNTPYETTAHILETLDQANISEVAFEVRKPGGVADTGWLTLTQWRAQPKQEEPVSFDGPAQRRWDELVQKWGDVYEACRRDHYVDCAGQPMQAAEGGEMEIRLFARGTALKAEFTRFGVEEEEESETAPQPQLLEGIRVPTGGEGEEEELPATEYGAFTWRFEGAVDELSPISGAFRPLCGANPCGIVITGDTDTPTMRLLSFVGAAFPNGVQAPHVAFVIPE